MESVVQPVLPYELERTLGGVWGATEVSEGPLRAAFQGMGSV
jgi:hypothetical protein